MNAIKENTVVFPKMKADQSGVLKVRYSNLDPDRYNIGKTTFGTGSTGSGSTGSGSTDLGSTGSGNNALGWFDSVTVFVSGMFTDITTLIGLKNEKQWGTESYNLRMAAEANAQAAANAKQKNTGLIIAVVAVAVVMVVGFGILIARKK